MRNDGVLKRSAVLLFLFISVADAQPHRIFVAGTVKKGVAVTPPLAMPLVIMFDVDQAKIIRNGLMKKCPDVAFATVTSQEAEWIVTVGAKRGAELRDKDGRLLYATNARAEPTMAKDICRYLHTL